MLLADSPTFAALAVAAFEYRRVQQSHSEARLALARIGANRLKTVPPADLFWLDACSPPSGGCGGLRASLTLYTRRLAC